MTITSVEKAHEKNMMKIFIDNHYAFAIPQEDYIRNNLYEEQDISEEKLEHIKHNVLVNAAREQAVRYLTIKDRSEQEIINKLTDAGFDSDVAKSASEALRGIGYIDDSIFAMRYLSERMRIKALSRKALKFELQQKGIDDETIETALSDFETDDSEVALRAARKKFGKYDIKDQKVEQKVISFLYHRGFSLDICKKVVKTMKEE